MTTKSHAEDREQIATCGAGPPLESANSSFVNLIKISSPGAEIANTGPGKSLGIIYAERGGTTRAERRDRFKVVICQCQLQADMWHRPLALLEVAATFKVWLLRLDSNQ
ncbi:MAG: hypothetical protein V9E85_03680 [Candidatus Nanopelagicales bacterium]